MVATVYDPLCALCGASCRTDLLFANHHIIYWLEYFFILARHPAIEGSNW
jgi:hypothetical protein